MKQLEKWLNGSDGGVTETTGRTPNPTTLNRVDVVHLHSGPLIKKNLLSIVKSKETWFLNSCQSSFTIIYIRTDNTRLITYRKNCLFSGLAHRSSAWLFAFVLPSLILSLIASYLKAREATTAFKSRCTFTTSFWRVAANNKFERDGIQGVPRASYYAATKQYK